MKKYNWIFSISVCITALAIIGFATGNDDDQHSFMSSGGAPAGYSGDPAGGNKDCTNCHSGSDAQVQSNWITSNIPGTGYVPGTTYTITSTASGEGISKFGFQISPQNSGGTVLGTLVNTNSGTKLVSGSDYLTHTSSGNTGTDSKTWTFEWTAPAEGSGEVVFYGAFNLADNNGSSSGDEIILSTLSINESESSGVGSNETSKRFMVYPNPARDHINIESALMLDASQFSIFDLSGKLVLSGSLLGSTTTISVESLRAGIYHVRLGDCNNAAVKFVKH